MLTITASATIEPIVMPIIAHIGLTVNGFSG